MKTYRLKYYMIYISILVTDHPQYNKAPLLVADDFDEDGGCHQPCAKQQFSCQVNNNIFFS